VITLSISIKGPDASFVMIDMAEMCDRLRREGHCVYSGKNEYTLCVSDGELNIGESR